MNNRLNKIIKDNFNEFDSWIEILNKERESIFSKEEISAEDGLKQTHETSSVLVKIINLAIKFGGFKDEFDTSKMYLNSYGLSLIIESAKTNQTFYLATDLKGIYLETSLIYGENLKNMDDLFWNEFLELKKFKGFEYEENSFFPIEVQRKYPKLFHTYKSAMFLMQRNFFISHTENYNDIDLGDFKVLWRPEGDFSKMIEEICLSFKLMYKLSYNCGR